MSRTILPKTDSTPISIQRTHVAPMTRDQFFDFCQQHSDKTIEQTACGELIVMPPSGGDAGFRDAEVCIQLGVWNKLHGNGKVMGPSGGFLLPNGANRAPDASWLSPAQMASVTSEQRKGFLPLCPIFLIEIKSPSDNLKKLQEKMEEYIANGCQLGWLIDPEAKQVHVYRPEQSPRILDNPSAVSGDPELPGFLLDLAPVWHP